MDEFTQFLVVIIVLIVGLPIGGATLQAVLLWIIGEL